MMVSTEQYLMHFAALSFAQEVTDILMETERVILHNWEGQKPFPREYKKKKKDTIGQKMFQRLF
jgi:DNA primase